MRPPTAAADDEEEVSVTLTAFSTAHVLSPARWPLATTSTPHDDARAPLPKELLLRYPPHAACSARAMLPRLLRFVADTIAEAQEGVDDASSGPVNEAALLLDRLGRSGVIRVQGSRPTAVPPSPPASRHGTRASSPPSTAASVSSARSPTRARSLSHVSSRAYSLTSFDAGTDAAPDDGHAPDGPRARPFRSAARNASPGSSPSSPSCRARTLQGEIVRLRASLARLESAADDRYAEVSAEAHRARLAVSVALEAADLARADAAALATQLRGETARRQACEAEAHALHARQREADGVRDELLREHAATDAKLGAARQHVRALAEANAQRQADADAARVAGDEARRAAQQLERQRDAMAAALAKTQDELAVAEAHLRELNVDAARLGCENSDLRRRNSGLRRRLDRGETGDSGS